MTTHMPVDPGSIGSSSQEMVMEPIIQVGQAIDIIDSVNRDRITSVTWNKHQCERIASRFNAIGERFKSMDWNRDGGKAANGGPIYDELVKILKKGAALISGYAKGITSTVVSRTVNPEAFQDIHAKLDIVEENLGFQDLRDGFELIPGMDVNMLKKDAKEDKKKMVDIFSQMQTGTEHSKKLAQVVSEKATIIDVKNSDRRKQSGASSALPSYLTIDQKYEIEIDKDQRIRKYVPLSTQDPAEQFGWASVLSGKWLGCDFAIKVFKCGSDAIRAQWNESQLLMEVGKLVELQHPHVVRLVGFGQDEEECVFVMELMEGDLRQLMKTKRAKLDEPFKESEELDIINQFAKGMYFMHMKGYAHGDLKCSNVLVNELGEHLEVKISDFRGSQSLDKEWDPEAFKQASLTRRPRWTAPEAIDHYGWVQPSPELLKQSDVYSFGMTCFEIVTGKYSFHGISDKKEVLRQIKDGAEKWNPFPPGLDEGLKGLITSCWNKEPSMRPDFKTICHVLDTIRSKTFADVKSKSCRDMVATILSQIGSQIKQIPAVERVCTGVENLVRGCNKRPSEEFLRSDSFFLAPEYRYTSIPPHQLKRVAHIGQGSDGRVYKSTWLGCTVAVKILKSKSITRDLQQEVEFLIKVSRHPCIVQMVGLSKNSSAEHSIVMEYMDGNLRQLIESRLKDESRKGRPFTFHEELLIITKFAWGMAYLHSRGLVHRDLKSANVLARDYTRTVDVKIVDFGRSYFGKSSETISERYYTGAGSGYYRAPEMLPIDREGLPAELELHEALPERSSTADLSALKATDVYSFAMICYEVLTGDFPCSELMHTEYAKVRGGYRPKWPLDPRPELKLLIELVEQCWSVDPTERLTFIDICTNLQSCYQ